MAQLVVAEAQGGRSGPLVPAAALQRGGEDRLLIFRHRQPEGAAALHQTWKNVTGMAEGLIPRLQSLAEAGATRGRRRS